MVALDCNCFKLLISGDEIRFTDLKILTGKNGNSSSEKSLLQGLKLLFWMPLEVALELVI